MYDFEGEHGGAAQHGGPSRLLTALEFPRWVAEYTTSRTLDVVRPSSDVGAGRPVLVLPGFYGDDRTTSRLRAHLRQQGFAAHGWRQGRNLGLTDPLLDGLTERFETLRDRYDQPVSLVGWSFGGLLGRWLSHRYPDDVRQLLCLASPWRADGEHTRATAMFERSRRKHGISDRARDIVDELRQPVPVPTTAVWSRTDGIVPWRGCRVDETDTPAVAENVEVTSSHVGMVANPFVHAVVVERLTRDPAAWQPFDWKRCLGDAFVPALQRTAA